MKKEITLSSYDIEQRLFTYSFYVGEARRAVGTPVQLTACIQASSDDHTQISDHTYIAVTEILTLMNRFLALCSNNVTNDSKHEGHLLFKLTFTPPRNFPEEMMDELRRTMESYMVMRTLNMWMLQHKPDEAVLTASEAEKLVVKLRELMCCRTKPRQSVKRKRTNIEI